MFVALIRQQLDEDWDHVHPQLDPEDDNDPMQRVQRAVSAAGSGPGAAAAARPAAREHAAHRRRLLARHRVTERRDRAEPGREKPTEAFVLGAFRDDRPGAADHCATALDNALADVPAIPAVFDAQGRPGEAGPTYDPAAEAAARHSARTCSASSRPSQDAAPSRNGGGGTPAAGRPAARSERAAPRARSPASRSITAFTSREDALYVLELASAYFRSQRPSSPLPLLIDRARRLAAMEFMDILRDLAPDGLSAGPNGRRRDKE